MRRRDTSTRVFRQLIRELSILLAYEVTRDLPLQEIRIETLLEAMSSRVIDGKKIVLAGHPARGQWLPRRHARGAAERASVTSASTATRRRRRRSSTKMPDDLPQRDVILLDPDAGDRQLGRAGGRPPQQAGPRRICFVCLLASPEGIAHISSASTRRRHHTPAIDRGLDEQGYIVPGLGDAGDRIFGTSEPGRAAGPGHGEQTGFRPSRAHADRAGVARRAAVLAVAHADRIELGQFGQRVEVADRGGVACQAAVGRALRIPLRDHGAVAGPAPARPGR